MNDDFRRFLKNVQYDEDSIEDSELYKNNLTDSMAQIHTTSPETPFYQSDSKPSEYNIQFNERQCPKKTINYEKFFSFRPAVHNYPAPKQRIEDRLLQVGKSYEERRRKMQMEEKFKQLEQEEQLIQSGKMTERKKSRGDVCTRLQHYNDKYKNRLEEKRKEREIEEMREIKQPEVNKISEKIVANMKRIERVEDRLLFSGEKMRLAKEERLKQAINDIKALSRGRVGIETKQIEEIDVVDRLTMYQKYYENRKILHKPNYLEKYPFQPIVNRTVNETLLSHRGKKRVKSTCKSRASNDCTFKPQLNKMSLYLAERLGPSEDRLLAGKENRPVLVEEPTYTPQINKLSEKIILQKQGVGQRRERLFQWEEERQARLEEQRRIVEEERLRDEEKYSFHPTLYTANSEILSRRSSSVLGSRSRADSVEKRTTLWYQQKEEKLRALQEFQQSRELHGCTFQPQLYNKPISRPAEHHNGHKKSIDKHIERMRAVRAEASRSSQKSPSRGGLWTSRDFQVVTPTLLTHNPPIQSLEKMINCDEYSDGSENYDYAIKNLHEDLLCIPLSEN